MEEIKINKPKAHILICTNQRDENIKPACGNHFNFNADVKELKDWIKENNLNGVVKVTRSSCLDVCPAKGIIILKYPEQKYYRVNDIEEVKQYIINLG